MSATKPFFVPQKEVNLIDSMNEELIDDILGQYVDIYKVSLDETENDIPNRQHAINKLYIISNIIYNPLLN